MLDAQDRGRKRRCALLQESLGQQRPVIGMDEVQEISHHDGVVRAAEDGFAGRRCKAASSIPVQAQQKIAGIIGQQANFAGIGLRHAFGRSPLPEFEVQTVCQSRGEQHQGQQTTGGEGRARKPAGSGEDRESQHEADQQEPAADGSGKTWVLEQSQEH